MDKETSVDAPDPTTTETSEAAEPQAAAAPSADERLAELQKERDELYDRLLRKTAEFDNFRKRTERERREQAEQAAVDLIRELLPLVDDFDRALQVDAAEGPDAYQRGVELIHKQLLDVLRKRGVEPIEALGADFDPHYHQAVGHEPSAGHRDGEVVAELRRGYMLGSKLLRPSMVRIARRDERDD